MKKRTAKKGFPIRLLAVLLCCFCLIAALPTYALEDGSQVVETQNNTPVPGDNKLDNTSNVGDNTIDGGGDEQNNTPGGDNGGQNNTSNDGVNTANLNQENNQQNQDEQNNQNEQQNQDEQDNLEQNNQDAQNTQDEQNNQEEQQNNGTTPSLYERLLVCTSVDEVNAILDNLTEEEQAEMDLFTQDQQDTLEAYLAEIGYYDINDLATATQKGYNGNNMVAYDIMINKIGQNDSKKLVSIQLNGVDVPHGDSTKTWGSQNKGYSGYTLRHSSEGTGNKLNTYYGNLTWQQSVKSVTLTIKPVDGYYVTNVVIPCCNGGVPSKCDVWQNSTTIFSEPFTLATGREVSISVPSSAFGHYTNSNTASRDGKLQYFIMVVVAEIPTPTYVEYDYGTIVELGGDTEIFQDAGAWTNVTSGNNYGTTSIPDTNYTQYRYTHAEGKPEDSKNWVHKANTVTADAKQNAASLGYYFAGWKATYYLTCKEVTSGLFTKPNPKPGNNKEYKFSDKYIERNYGEGENVEIFSHVQLVAQWKPIELNVTKQVTGMAEIETHANTEHTFQLKLQKLQDGNYVDVSTQDYTIKGDGVLTKTFAKTEKDVDQIITPGTYRVEEIGTTNFDGAYCTTTYDPQVVVVGIDGTVKELKVVNTYSGTPPTATLTIKKTVSGNMYSEDKNFSFTVTYGDETKQFTLKGDPDNGNTYTIEGVPVGASVTVTENPDKYTFSVVTGEGGTTVTNYTAVTNGISFTMPSSDTTVVFNNENNANIDTGVILDALPYVLILAIVAGGVVLMLLRRRRSYED